MKLFDMQIPNTLFGPLLGAIVGAGITIAIRLVDDSLFGAKLKIDFQHAPGNKDEDNDYFYIKFRVQNTRLRRVAKHCRAYLVELHKISNRTVVSENLLPDTFQLSWPNSDFEPRDIPAKVAQYADLVLFSKHNSDSDWLFHTKPGLYPSLTPLKKYRGTYLFTVVVAGDAAVPRTRKICVDYNGNWKSATLWDW